VEIFQQYKLVIQITNSSVLNKLQSGLFCVGTRRYGVPGNENDESIVCMSVLY